MPILAPICSLRPLNAMGARIVFFQFVAEGINIFCRKAGRFDSDQKFIPA